MKVMIMKYFANVITVCIVMYIAHGSPSSTVPRQIGDIGLTLGMLESKLHAPSYVQWSENFNGNPMLMAQIQAGMKAEKRVNLSQKTKKLLKEHHGKRFEIKDYLPDSYYQTRVHRYYAPPHGPRGFHGQKYSLLYKYKYFYG